MIKISKTIRRHYTCSEEEYVTEFKSDTLLSILESYRKTMEEQLVDKDESVKKLCEKTLEEVRNLELFLLSYPKEVE